MLNVIVNVIFFFFFRSNHFKRKRLKLHLFYPNTPGPGVFSFSLTEDRPHVSETHSSVRKMRCTLGEYNSAWLLYVVTGKENQGNKPYKLT